MISNRHRDLDYDIDKLLRELRHRIPKLFDPALPVCPGDYVTCDCTYESGCKLLRKNANDSKP